MDYSDQFTTYSIFNGRDELLRWAREQEKLNNIVIVIKRSDYGGEGKRRPRVILACERNGNYKSCKSSETTDIRDTGTKKCGCPFLLKGVNIGDGDDWKLEVGCGVHNHPISEYLQGHSFVGRLTEEENALLVDMSKSLVKPRDILVTIKDSDAMNVSTMKTIYNARIRNRTKEFAGRTQMQQLLTKLSEHKYIEWHMTSGDIKGPLLGHGTCSWTETATFRQTFSLFENRRKIRRQDLLGLTTTALWAEAEVHERDGQSIINPNILTKRSHSFRSDHQPLDQSIKCVPTAKSAEPKIKAVAEIYGGHTTMLHDPKCRFDYPLAPIRLHHASQPQTTMLHDPKCRFDYPLAQPGSTTQVLSALNVLPGLL
ncbi:unnamed protein product [Prunus armeniaca]